MSELPAPTEIMTVDEVASMLRVNRSTICRWCQAGKLPAFRIGHRWRVHRRGLEKLMQAGWPG